MHERKFCARDKLDYGQSEPGLLCIHAADHTDFNAISRHSPTPFSVSHFIRVMSKMFYCQSGVGNERIKKGVECERACVWLQLWQCYNNKKNNIVSLSSLRRVGKRRMCVCVRKSSARHNADLSRRAFYLLGSFAPRTFFPRWQLHYWKGWVSLTSFAAESARLREAHCFNPRASFSWWCATVNSSRSTSFAALVNICTFIAIDLLAHRHSLNLWKLTVTRWICNICI